MNELCFRIPILCYLSTYLGANPLSLSCSNSERKTFLKEAEYTSKLNAGLYSLSFERWQLHTWHLQR